MLVADHITSVARIGLRLVVICTPHSHVNARSRLWPGRSHVNTGALPGLGVRTSARVATARCPGSHTIALDKPRLRRARAQARNIHMSSADEPDAEHSGRTTTHPQYRCPSPVRLCKNELVTVTSLLDRAIYSFADVDRLVGLRPGTAKRWIDGYTRADVTYSPVLRPETSRLLGVRRPVSMDR
jgi:hypothetical protein